tara:strand:- start:39 stop:224 length:186 start_codon:yes stop_codon:yes gene_type:complete
MNVGDAVRINATHVVWDEAQGQIGVVIALAKRLYIPAAKVMVLGEVAEWDQDELEVISECR